MNNHQQKISPIFCLLVDSGDIRWVWSFVEISFSEIVSTTPVKTAFLQLIGRVSCFQLTRTRAVCTCVEWKPPNPNVVYDQGWKEFVATFRVGLVGAWELLARRLCRCFFYSLSTIVLQQLKWTVQDLCLEGKGILGKANALIYKVVWDGTRVISIYSS